MIVHGVAVLALHGFALLSPPPPPEPPAIRVMLDRGDEAAAPAATPTPAPQPASAGSPKAARPTPKRVIVAVAPAAAAAPADASAVAGVAAAPPESASVGAAQVASRGPGDAAPVAADPEAAIAAYVSLVRTRIETHKRYPSLARSRGVEGIVLALVHLDATGAVGEVEILDSPSGLLSDPTREAIVDSGPFPPPPGDLRRIRVPVRYALQ